LALKYRSVVDQLRRVSGKSISRLYIIGGGAKNKLLCQFTANATGLPVSSGPVEATAIGNILVQAMALGHVSSPAEMREIIRNSFELERFEPGQEQDWREAYERFKTISHA
jgi:sugar (pentulose or hexulose) kinase